MLSRTKLSSWLRPSKPHRAISGSVAASLCLGALFAYSAPSAEADACSDVEVVFARGTGEPAGIGIVGQTFIDALRAQLTFRTISVYAVNYPATYDFMKAAEGANDASAHIQTTASTCPGTDIVLGGFSQGAAVIAFATASTTPIFGFTNLLPPALASHIAAVAVFGNPGNKIGRPLTTMSPLYGAKTIDLCNGADPVCSGGNDRPAHSEYPRSGLVEQAATFAAQRVSGATSVPTGA